MDAEIEVESGILTNGTEVSWEGRGGVEHIGSVIGYLDDGLYLVMDNEDDRDHEVQYESLTILNEA